MDDDGATNLLSDALIAKPHALWRRLKCDAQMVDDLQSNSHTTWKVNANQPPRRQDRQETDREKTIRGNENQHFETILAVLASWRLAIRQPQKPRVTDKYT